MAEISFRLSRREAAALADDQDQLRRWGVRKSQARQSAEFKLRAAIWAAYPQLKGEDQR